MSAFRAALPRKPGVGMSLQSSEAIAARLDDLERKLERLRALYESFFLGVERRPPQVPRQELNRLMLETQQLAIRNVALRFRFQALSQRWTLLTTYWNRTLREIESGTYRRDLQKAYRRIAARGEPLTEGEAATLGIPLGRAKAFVAQQNRRWGTEPPLVPQQSNAAPPDAGAQPSVRELSSITEATSTTTTTAAAAADSEDLVTLGRAYAEAHARLALAGPPPTIDRIRAKVLPHLNRLRAAHPGTRLDVRVVAENGRIVLRAKPVT
jgi:hypothetical protein